MEVNSIATQSLRFLVQGSAEQPYIVTFERIGPDLRCNCTCDAAAAGTHCKHRLGILAGEAGAIVSDNHADVAQVPPLLAGTRLAAALAEMAQAEAAADAAKKRLSNAKKAIGRLMAE